MPKGIVKLLAVWFALLLVLTGCGATASPAPSHSAASTSEPAPEATVGPDEGAAQFLASIPAPLRACTLVGSIEAICDAGADTKIRVVRFPSPTAAEKAVPNATGRDCRHTESRVPYLVAGKVKGVLYCDGNGTVVWSIKGSPFLLTESDADNDPARMVEWWSLTWNFGEFPSDEATAGQPQTFAQLARKAARPSYSAIYRDNDAHQDQLVYFKGSVEQYTKDPDAPFVVLVHVRRDRYGLYSGDPIGLQYDGKPLKSGDIVEFIGRVAPLVTYDSLRGSKTIPTVDVEQLRVVKSG